MSTTPNPPAAATPLPNLADAKRELRIYSHSALFYWWPVWAFGYIMALLTYLDGGRMLIVPKSAEVGKAANGTAKGLEDDTAINLDGKRVIAVPGDYDKLETPRIHMAHSKNYGVVFVAVLLMIIFISNVPLRGLWSLIILLFIGLMIFVFAFFEIWDRILSAFFLLQIYINAGGYVFIATVLLIIWFFTVFIFDRRTYLVISSGQIRMCLAVGASETMQDTTGMQFSKKQDDLFRHWIVGLGSGDLIVHRTATTQDIDLPNVLFIGSKIREIERLIKEREVV